MHITIQQVDVHVPIYKKRALSDSFFILACGERGIRTPGASQLNGFQDRRNRPLCHLSSSECACRMNDACQRPWATAIPPLSSKPRASRMMFFRNRVQKYCFFFKYTNFL